MIPRDRVVGRKITDVYKSPSEFGPAVTVDGISTEDDVMELFSVFLELDEDDLLKVGLDERDSPMELLDARAKQSEGLSRLLDDVDRECIGEVIQNVYREGMGFIMELESGSALWVADDIFGTGLVLSRDYLELPQITTTPLTDYWAT